MKPYLSLVSQRSLGPKPVSIPPPIGVPTTSTITLTELPTPVNLSLYSGDDFTMILTVMNPDGTPTNLAGTTVKSQIRPNPASSTISATLHWAIQANVITLSLIGTDSQNLVGNYSWDCQITNTNAIVQTLVAGTATFTQDVTRP